MTKRIAVVPGDGIGKEVIPNALEVVRAIGRRRRVHHLRLGRRPLPRRRHHHSRRRLSDAGARLRRHLRRRAGRSARGHQYSCQRNSAGHALQDGPLRQRASGAPARCFAVSAEKRHARRHQLHRHPREHRRRVHGHGRQLQVRHARRGRHAGGHQHAQGRGARHPLRLRVRARQRPQESA